MKISVVGTGYVGLSLAILLSQHHNVTAVDIMPEKVELINHWQSPVQDEYIEKYLKEHEERGLSLHAVTDGNSAFAQADYVVISTPTNYDPERHYFDCSSVKQTVKLVLDASNSATIVIKSTVPVGYTEKLRERFHTDRILFSPEFLRESKALYDNLYPSRIIVGCDENSKERAEKFACMLIEGAEKADIAVLYMGFKEAEAVKLFANTYLALRVSFFNELDTYAEVKGLETKTIIDGVCQDPRIGTHYNNPSFGYGGYCLPKDTKQLLASFQDVPGNLIESIVESNRIRKEYIADRILEKARASAISKKQDEDEQRKITVGVYRLSMKSDSDDFRCSSVQDVIICLKQKGVEIKIYEPSLPDRTLFFGSLVTSDLDRVKKESDIIIANRYDHCLDDVADKVYTRDLFERD